MSHAGFVHLRNHTAYSLSEGAIHIRDMARLCVEGAMPAVAMTDTANMFGALEFSQALWERGVQPIIGVTLPVTVPGPVDPRSGKTPPAAPLVLLAQSAAGYKNLMKLVSRAHLDSDGHEPAHLGLAGLEGLTDGIIALTGGADGPLGRLLRDGQRDRADALVDSLLDLFPDRLYMEIQRHDLPEEAETEDAFIDIAYARDIPLLATNQCYYPTADMHKAHDALLCIAEGSYVRQDDRRRVSPQHYFKSAAEMRETFSDLPEAVDNTLVVARRCAHRLEVVDPILPNFAAGADRSEADMLRDESEAGLTRRLASHVHTPDMDEAAREDAARPYRERLAHELEIINQMGFPGYFLIVADFIQWAKDNDIPVGPGRGSGAGSVVAWALRITDLDPLRFSLLFERFLNPERVSMPDFDVDFCQDKRERVIRYVQEKYGTDQVAQIITFGKLQARAVLRDVGRVLEQPYPVTDRLCKMIPADPANPKTLAQALQEEPRLKAERRSDDTTREVIDLALKLEGLYRHASTHAAGVVIGDRPLDELVPLYRDPRADMPVTQFNMKWVEQAGLVKFDFLGLKTLTVLDRALHMVRDRGVRLRLEDIPFEDAGTFRLLQDGDTAAVFQLESAGMRNVLRGLKPDKFEDIIAIVALYRPGPMENIQSFINRKHKREAIEYPHPMLEQILEETYGIPVYQEQVMQIAQVMAGFSLGEADLLRRAMGKKIAAEMDKQRARFVTGACDKGVPEAKAHEIFDLLAKFADYGFNKSHAAAYALIAYHTAYMKANYPVEFMAATMSLDMNNTDKLGAFRKELARAGIELLPPDVNRSGVEFTVEPVAGGDAPSADDPRAGLGIRYALAAIKGVGRKAMEGLVAARAADGPFRDVIDLAGRLDPQLMNKRQIEQLAAAGAFDSLDISRAAAHGAAEDLMRHCHACAEARDSNQVSLFGDEELAAQSPASRVRDAAVWTDSEALAHELSAVGFYLSAHPLDAYATVLKRLQVKSASNVQGGRDYVGQTVKMAGAIESFSERRSRRTGKRFGLFNLSDSSGGFEIMVFEDDLDDARILAEKGAPILVDTMVKSGGDESDSVRLSARGLKALETVAGQTGARLEIHLGDDKALEPLQALLDRYRGGSGRVSLIVKMNSTTEAMIDVPGPFKVTPELSGGIRNQAGVLDVQEI